jgi:hypothetical protein
MPGNVYVFNPTATDYLIGVNGPPTISLLGTSSSLGWVAGVTNPPLARTSDGNPANGKFGWTNHIVIEPTDGSGLNAQFDLVIPKSIQNANDIQLYVYYSSDFTEASYTVLNAGAIFASGGLTALAG